MSRFFARKFVRHRRLNAWGLSFKNGYGAILCLWEIGLWQMLFLWPWAWGVWKGRGGRAWDGCAKSGDAHNGE